jgi:hypothetical protein
MKSAILSVSLSIIFLMANAQLSIGPKVGLNVSMASTNNPNRIIDPIAVAFNVGALVNYKFQIPIALQAETFFSGEGTELKNKGNKDIFHERDGYFNIPVLFQFKPKGGFYLEAGPQLGILMYAKETVNGSTTDVKGDFNSSKISGCFGLGYQIKERFGFGARYAVGLTNISAGSTYTTKDNVFSFDVFYAFHIGGK